MRRRCRAPKHAPTPRPDRRLACSGRHPPFEPWAPRSYAIFVTVIAVAEVVVGSGLFLTLSNIKIELRPLPARARRVQPLDRGARRHPRGADRQVHRQGDPVSFVSSSRRWPASPSTSSGSCSRLRRPYLIGGFNVTTAPATGTGSPSSSSTPLPTVAATPTATTGGPAPEPRQPRKLPRRPWPV